MANRIVLEIDDLHYRLAKVSVEGQRVQVSRAVEFPVVADDDVRAKAVKLKEALQSGGLGRGDCDVILSRKAIELREISLPPAPDEELPDMVRFSSRNEFASVNENWSLDFIPLTDAQDQQRVVLAGALPPQIAQDIRQTCELAGLKVQRMLVRPFCTAQALVPGDEAKPVLLVHDLGNELELTLVHAKKVFMTRTVKLPEGASEQRLAAMVQEIQRSQMLAARSAAGRAIGETLIATAPMNRGGLTKLMAERELASCELIDVCQRIVEQGGTLDAAEAEKFVAHYGAGLAQAERAWPTLDFVAPRRRIEKKTDYRRMALIGALAATLLVSVVGFCWYLLSEQASRIARLEKEHRLLKESNDKMGVDQIVGEVQLVDNWQRSNLNWLEELREVSQRLLTADEAMVGYLKAELARTGPEIILRGRLNERETNTELKSNLAERPYQVEQRKNVMSIDSKEYPFEFEYALLMDRSGVNVVQQIGQRIRELAAAKSPTATPAAQTAESPTANEEKTAIEQPATDEKSADGPKVAEPVKQPDDSDGETEPGVKSDESDKADGQ